MRLSPGIYVLLISLTCSTCAASAKRLTPEQRDTADALVGARIAQIRDQIVKRADLPANIERLSRRQKAFHAWEPAMRVGWCARNCKGQHVRVPEAINGQVVADIIWQYENAYGDRAERKYHREECARALGFIGDPKGVPTILQSLEREGGHFSWQALEGIWDSRFIPAINAHLDFSSHQDASPAIACLSHLGEAAIPTLRRFLKGRERPLQRAAVEALIQVGSPKCLPLLEEAVASEDSEARWKAEAGMMQIQCRAIDKIYRPSILPEEDESRLYHLAHLALRDDDAAKRKKAADVLVSIGLIATGVLRPQLANGAHYDGPRGPAYIVAPRASEILTRMGEPAIPCLIDALTDEFNHTRVLAAETLQRISSRALGPDYEAWSKWFLERRRQGTTPTRDAG